jgi:hypothetical protein
MINEIEKCLYQIHSLLKRKKLAYNRKKNGL